MLKNDEVDSKIRITDDMLWTEYEKNYSPRWLIEYIFLFNEDQSKKAYESLTRKKISFHELAKRYKEQGIRCSYQKRWFRPLSVPPEWKPSLKALKPGEISTPVPWAKALGILKIREVKGPEQQDFEKLRKRIKKRIWEAEEARLTKALVERLKKKYRVKVDWKLFEVLDPENPPEQFLDQALITTNRGNVTVRLFVQQIKKELKFRKRFHFKKEEIERIKSRVLNGIISQTLISWESLDRHYEEKPPFKWTYRFYCQHRMIRELEKRLFEPKVKITEKDIETYYRKHIDEFTRPETVTIAVLEDDKRLADKIWAEITRGEDFFEVVKKYYSKDVPIKKVPFNHLDKVVKKIVQGLSKGEVSSPFDVKGHAIMVKLIDRTPATPLPLDHVKKKIARRLEEEKFRQIKADYLKELRARSIIKINKKVWKQLERELGGLNENKG